MSRYFGYDVITDIKTELVAELNTNITTINTTRSTAASLIKKFSFAWTENQFPTCFIDLENSEIFNNENELTNNIELEAEEFTLLVTIENKSNKTRETFALEMEIYAEAVLKTLHGFNNSGIIWCISTGTDRAEIDVNQNQTHKFITVNFSVKVR